MPTTSYVEFDAAARALGARTDSAGTPVGDLTAEEDRLIQATITQGYLTDDAFQVTAPGGAMTVTVGSGSAKADLYAIEGQIAGQGVYLARLDESPVTVTIAAAEASQVRNDEVYLVIADDAYDASGLVLPRIGYRKGDPGGAAPGPDAAWEAWALLATVNVPAAASTINLGNVTDERTQALSTLATPTPPGTIVMYAGQTAPAGWLLCNGVAFSRTIYANLFAAIGTAYGAGDGSTTFNVPDLDGRFPVGAGVAYDEGDQGGEDAHQLTEAEMPSHTHAAGSYSAASGGSHDHSDLGATADNGVFNDLASGSQRATVTITGSTNGAHTHTILGSSSATGGISAHENRPPYTAVNFIIKV